MNEIEIRKLKNQYGENLVHELENGKIMVRDMGKTGSKLCFMLDKNSSYPIFMEDKELEQNMNVIWDGTPEFCYGEFWTSKKGAKMFTVNPEGKHLLVKVQWGGSCNYSHGDFREMLPASSNNSKIIYGLCGRTNGGGAGNSYFIVEREYVQEIDIDDL